MFKKLHGKRPEGRQLDQSAVKLKKLTQQRARQEEATCAICQGRGGSQSKPPEGQTAAEPQGRCAEIDQAAAALTVNLSNAMKEATSKLP